MLFLIAKILSALNAETARGCGSDDGLELITYRGPLEFFDPAMASGKLYSAISRLKHGLVAAWKSVSLGLGRQPHSGGVFRLRAVAAADHYRHRRNARNGRERLDSALATEWESIVL